MYPILEAEALNKNIIRMVISAPAVAKKIQPGQFIMLRIDEVGERIPVTMNDYNREAGTVTIVVKPAGATTLRLTQLKAGDALQDFAGPFGKPTDFEGVEHVCVIGGGVGTAIAYSQAKMLNAMGCHVDVIIGFRDTSRIVLEREMAEVSDHLIVMTDDGSNGNKGNVTTPLKERLEAGVHYDLVLAIGPVIMMKFVALATKPFGIRTLVSMNPLMIDGTGMCGGCRVKVGNEYLHACVDGPDFDGHQVDFDDAMRRGVMYKNFERRSKEHLIANAVEDGIVSATEAHMSLKEAHLKALHMLDVPGEKPVLAGVKVAR